MGARLIMLRATVRRLPLHRKLTLIGVLTSGSSLLLACAALFAFEIHGFREVLLRKVTTQAEIIAYNAGSALLFGDQRAAGRTLAALHSEPYLLGAAIFDEEGALFAHWRAAGAPPAGLPANGLGGRSHDFRGGELALYEPIVVDGERIGALLLRSDMRELSERVFRFAVIAAGVLAASLFAATLLFSLGQRVVTRPIIQLADIARTVSVHKDYSVRAEPRHEDEVGLLVNAFNEMLGEIERREKTLREEVEAKEQAQLALARQAEELMRSNKELESFAYVASHDLQEPLRMVASYTQLLAQEYRGKLDPEAEEYIEFAVGGAKRMQRLIEALLSYSRISTEGCAIAPVDIDAALDEALANLEPSMAETGAVVTRSRFPTVLGHRARFCQLLQNLIGNAIKYRRGAPRIHVGAVVDGDTCVVSVRDNGIGIDPKYHARIFEMFQRLHTQSEYDGTGIGLSLCQRIVESHGGRIWVESKPGAGSCFFFSASVAQIESRADDELVAVDAPLTAPSGAR